MISKSPGIGPSSVTNDSPQRVRDGAQGDDAGETLIFCGSIGNLVRDGVIAFSAEPTSSFDPVFGRALQGEGEASLVLRGTADVAGSRAPRLVKASLSVRGSSPPGFVCDPARLTLSLLNESGEVLAIAESSAPEGNEPVSLSVEIPMISSTRQVRFEFHCERVRDRGPFMELLGLRIAHCPHEVGSDETNLILEPHWQLVGPECAEAVFATGRSDILPKARLVSGHQTRSRIPIVTTTFVDGLCVHRVKVGCRDGSSTLEIDGKGFHRRVLSCPDLADWPKSLRFAVFGDNQHGAGVFRRILARAKSMNPRFLLAVGDLVQNGDRLADWTDQWFRPLAETGVGASIPLMLVRGNHDGEGRLAHALARTPGGRFWSAATLGSARFVFLDSELSPDDVHAQTRWLEEELASAASRAAAFRIVTFHRPPFTALWHEPGYDGELSVRRHWVPLLERSGVDLVLSGHAHCYQRGSRSGVTYVVSGGGGGRLDHVRQPAESPIVKTREVHHFVIVDLEAETLRLTAIDQDGEILDTIELRSSKVNEVNGSRPSHSVG